MLLLAADSRLLIWNFSKKSFIGKRAMTCTYSDVKNKSGINNELCVILQHLRDPDGHQYSPYEYSLQQSADGSVLLVPRTNSSAMLEPELTRQKHKERDPHHKE